MIDFRKTQRLKDAEVANQANHIVKAAAGSYDAQQVYAQVLGMIDLTTLEGSDTRQKVQQLCQKALSYEKMEAGLPNVAAVCVYPTLIEVAKKSLEGTPVKIASVAGAFPAGQSPLNIKVAEVQYAVEQGADEIDMVISRGSFLEGEYQKVFDEIAAIRQACGEAHLKVIIETGELQSATNIRRASEIAIRAGAHFIKTSTGKIQPAATLPAAYVMLNAIKDYFDETGQMIGFKPAGGIADPETAFYYYVLVDQILGENWTNKQWLRFGASRLADKLADAVKTARR